MAISTIGTYLLDGGLTTGAPTFTAPLVAIKDIPDLEGEREEIETTTLSDTSRVFIEGLKNNASLMFTCNYTKAKYEAIAALAGTQRYFGVFLGGLSGSNPTGDEGMWVFTGSVSVRKMGGGVGEVHEMSVKIVLSSGVTPYYDPTLVKIAISTPVVENTAATLTLTYIGIPTAPTLAYVWYTATTETGTYSAISGATSATYTPQEGDAGKWIKCKVTATGTATGEITSAAVIVTAD